MIEETSWASIPDGFLDLYVVPVASESVQLLQSPVEIEPRSDPPKSVLGASPVPCCPLGESAVPTLDELAIEVRDQVDEEPDELPKPITIEDSVTEEMVIDLSSAPPPAVTVPTEDATEPLDLGHAVAALRRSASDVTRAMRPHLNAPTMTIRPRGRRKPAENDSSEISTSSIPASVAPRLESSIHVRGLTDSEVSSLPEEKRRPSIDTVPLSPVPITPLCAFYPNATIEPTVSIVPPLSWRERPQPRRTDETRGPRRARPRKKKRQDSSRTAELAEAAAIMIIASIFVLTAVEALASVDAVIGGGLPESVHTVAQLVIGAAAALWVRARIEIRW